MTKAMTHTSTKKIQMAERKIELGEKTLQLKTEIVQQKKLYMSDKLQLELKKFLLNTLNKTIKETKKSFTEEDDPNLKSIYKEELKDYLRQRKNVLSDMNKGK